MVALKRAVGFSDLARVCVHLLGTGVFRHRFGAFGDGVFGQFSWQQQTHGGLDFARGDRRAFVVVRQTRRFSSDALEDIVHERIPEQRRSEMRKEKGREERTHMIDMAFEEMPVSGWTCLRTL